MICSKCGYRNSDDQIRCAQCSMDLDRFESPTLDYRMATNQVNVGEVFAGRYRIVRLLKVGGMSFVYEAFDEKVQQKIALKILKPGLTDDATTIRRFQGEVRLARRIGHQNVCRIFDLEESNGVMFISMEMIEGVNLKEHIQKSGPMPEQEGIRFCIQTLEGLQSAHSSGIIHRDLKPQNIMIDTKGNPRILDFGLSRALDTEGVTLFGAVMGTPGYMAPEQGLGETAEERSDLYSVGAIMYEMFTGTLPFQAETPAKLIYKHVYTTPADPRKKNPTLSPALSKVILKCLEKKKERRYRNVNELIQALRLLEEGKTLPANLVSAPKFRPAILVLIIAALAVVGTVGYLSYQYLRKPEKRVAVTILPFRNQTGNQELDASMLTLTENVILAVANSPRIKVFPYDRLFEAQHILEERGFPGIDREAIKLLGELNGSAFVIVPTIFQYGNTLKVNLELKDPMTGDNVKLKTWDYVFDRTPQDKMVELIKDSSVAIEKEVAGKGGEFTPLHTDLEVLLDYNRGKNAFLEGRYMDAVASFETCLQRDPGFPDALIALADAYHGMGYDAEAQKFAQQAFLTSQEKKLPNDRKLRIEAKLAEFNYDTQRAEKLYQELIKISPDGTLYLSLGKTLDSLARIDEAHAAFQKALELSPHYPEAYMAEGELFTREGKNSEALNSFDRAFMEYKRLQNTDLQALVLMERFALYRNAGELAQAETFLLDAESLARNSSNPLMKARLVKLHADLDLEQKKTDDAIRLYLQAIQSFRDAGDENMVGSIYVNIGSTYSMQRKAIEAEQYLMKGLDTGKKIQSYTLIAEACSNLVTFHKNQKNFDKALAYLKEAKINDQKMQNENGLIYDIGLEGDINLEQRKYAAAYAAYREQLAKANRISNRGYQAQAYYGIGEYFYEIENYPKALESFNKGIELNQSLKIMQSVGYGLLFRAKCYTAQGLFSDSDHTLDEVEKMILDKKFTRLAQTQNARGENELQKGNWKEADHYFEKAAKSAIKVENKDEELKARFYSIATPALETGKVNISKLEQAYSSLDPLIQPGFASIVAFAYVKNQESQKALELLMKQEVRAKEKLNTRCIMLFQLASIQRMLGNDLEASRYLQNAKDLSNQINFKPVGKVTEALLKT